MKCNGTYALQVQTRHGRFAFFNQKFWCSEGRSFAFLQTAEDCPSAVTRGVKALAVQMCLWTASYQKACLALTEVTGAALVTRQTLCHSAAARLDTRLAGEVTDALQTSLPPLAERVDVYDPNTAELVVFEDGILVKAQKPTHEKRAETKAKKLCQFHQAYFALAPRPDGVYEFVLGSGNGTVSLPSALRAFVCAHWQNLSEPLAVVAITDGAKDLRNDLDAAFGKPLVQILDWYHLRKKVCELCSMLVATKDARTALKKQVLRPLFFGKVSEALEVLSAVPVRNAFQHQKLVTYLTKHAHEIIDYARRQQAGKPIGSGRMEKGVDCVVGMRQKDRGMSWSKSGSYALAMLTAYAANGHGDHLWNPVPDHISATRFGQ